MNWHSFINIYLIDGVKLYFGYEAPVLMSMVKALDQVRPETSCLFSSDSGIFFSVHGMIIINYAEVRAGYYLCL